MNKCFPTNLPKRKLSQRKAKRIYQLRWNVETCNKELKGSYDLENFRVRDWEAIQKIVSLTLLAFNISQHYLRVWQTRFKGLDRKVKKIFSSIFNLRKFIQKLLNFGLPIKYWLNLAVNWGNGP